MQEKRVLRHKKSGQLTGRINCVSETVTRRRSVSTRYKMDSHMSGVSMTERRKDGRTGTEFVPLVPSLTKRDDKDETKTSLRDRDRDVT